MRIALIKKYNYKKETKVFRSNKVCFLINLRFRVISYSSSFCNYTFDQTTSHRL